MKLDFDTFEFAGLVAPGVIIVLAALLLWPQLGKSVDAAVVIVLAILASYVVGHLVAAVGNIAEPIFKRFGVRGLESRPYEAWEKLEFIAPDQKERLELLLRVNLHRGDSLDWEAFKKMDSLERKTVVKQMYLAVAFSKKPQRVMIFDGMYSLSRGIAISLLVCALAAFFFGRIAPALFCLLGASLGVYRMDKFKKSYCKELLQQFLLQNEGAA